jgi:hypothetical protein
MLHICVMFRDLDLFIARTVYHIYEPESHISTLSNTVRVRINTFIYDLDAYDKQKGMAPCSLRPVEFQLIGRLVQTKMGTHKSMVFIFSTAEGWAWKDCTLLHLVIHSTPLMYITISCDTYPHGSSSLFNENSHK